MKLNVEEGKCIKLILAGLLNLITFIGGQHVF